MKLSYDADHNIAYLRLHEQSGPVTTLKISDEINIDIAPDGTVYGIGLMNANAQLAEHAGEFVIDIGGAEKRIPLAA
jgi:uncharacterized protein YuzE